MQKYYGMDKNDYKIIKSSIKKGEIIEIKKILEEKPDLINEITPFGSWLQIAAMYGQFEIAQYLIDKNIDINKCGGVLDGGPLAEACSKGHLNIIKLLLEKGANIDVSTSSANPLFAAIYNGHFDVVKFLVEKGIDIKATYEIGDIKECGAYEYARQYGQTEIANYLKSLL